MPVVPAVAADRYYLNQELAEYLRVAEESAPHLLRLYTLGSSSEGRPVVLAEVTNRATGEGHEKPAIWIDGGWRGGALLGSSACLELIRQLISSYGREAVISDLLDHITFYICPRLAVDAADLSLTTGEWCWSSTRLVVPLASGLRAGDVNGDGRCLQMRLEDPLGAWKVSRRDARLLVPRGPDDRGGPFYRLLPEGSMEGAGPLRVAARQEIDLERNFPGCTGPEAGPYPFSEPETRLVADFLRSHSNLSALLTWSNLEGGISVVGGSASERALFARLGRKIQEWTGLPVQISDEPGYLDWAHRTHGLLAVRAEPWSLVRAAGLEKSEDGRGLDEPELSSVLRWLDRECPQAFQPWTRFQHPQLGPVDIGGWEWLYSWLNPPPGPLLQAELERFSRLALGLAQSLPRLHVAAFHEDVVGWTSEQAPLRKLQLTVENHGYLPTSAGSSDAQLQVQLQLDGGAQLLMGGLRRTAGQLAGTGLLDGEGAVPYHGASTAQLLPRWETEWLVAGEGAVALEALHARAGRRVVHLQSRRAEAPAPPSYPGAVPAVAYAPPAYVPAPATRPAPAVRQPAPPPPPAPAPVRPAAAVPARPQPLTAPPPLAAPPAAVPSERGSGGLGAPPALGGLAAPPAAAVAYAAPSPPAGAVYPAAAAQVTQPMPAAPPAPAALAAPPPAQSLAAPPVARQGPPVAGGRVLGNPPPKPGAAVSSYAARVQEQLQGRAQAADPYASQPPVAPPPAAGGGEFQAFSPGLPIRRAAAPAPIESPPAMDYDDMPPEAPVAESRISPLLLRREKRK